MRSLFGGSSSSDAEDSYSSASSEEEEESAEMLPLPSSSYPIKFIDPSTDLPSICSKPWPAAIDLINYLHPFVRGTGEKSDAENGKDENVKHEVSECNNHHQGKQSAEGDEGGEGYPPRRIFPQAQGESDKIARAEQRLRKILALARSREGEEEGEGGGKDEPLKVLELGGGVGVASIGVCNLFLNENRDNATAKSIDVTCTDLAVAEDLMGCTIDLNADLWRGVAMLRTGVLEWGAGGKTTEDIKRCIGNDGVNLIIATDCVYWASLHTPFLTAVRECLESCPADSICVITGVRRWKRDTKFYSRLTDGKEGLEGVCVKETVKKSEGGKRDISRVYIVWLKQQNQCRNGD